MTIDHDEYCPFSDAIILPTTSKCTCGAHEIIALLKSRCENPSHPDDCPNGCDDPKWLNS